MAETTGKSVRQPGLNKAGRLFLATGRMNPSTARAMRKRMELTRKRAGKKPKPEQTKPPTEGGPKAKTMPIRKPIPPGARRIKKPAQRIGGPTRIQ